MSNIPELKRATIWVRDIERSIDFYSQVIGLDVLERKDLSGPAIAGIVGFRDGRLRIAHLGRPGSRAGWIGLYELTEADPPVESLPPPPADRIAHGQATVVFECEEIEAVVQRLRDSGCRMLRPPSRYPLRVPGASVPVILVEAIVFDPDGVLVSVMGTLLAQGTVSPP
jgi:catechol 2,3-dioxygenase-like lactoylglutathione lyase family enzyme